MTRQAPWTLERLTPHLGASVSDIQLHALDDVQLALLQASLVEHKVLFFPNQQWTARQQRDFAARLGELHVHPTFEAHADADELVVFNYDETRKGANDTWHADVTFGERPLKYGVLHADAIPALGGDTLWVDTEAAFAALSAPLRNLLQGLDAMHSVLPAMGYPALIEQPGWLERLQRLPAPSRHPVVRIHPVSGRPSLFVNQAFTSHIIGLQPAESQALLALLFRHLESPQFQVRWRWQANCAAIWDNRSTQHLAVSDYFPAVRQVRRAAVLEDSRPQPAAAREGTL
ncbi:TauD/TfdA family dioxygenase [Pseudomonas typographi]|uniref:Taurine dioxygenase n=1 Tax=Pseudomonas typographi TaxID=2715964 RepID=A0ABR7Z121_9PSED|nr:TauD/TfdA family dioxygenase [Pseudomonas typographi]MBD1552286.1 taurine dioxygenase [Pseudomonas typographi]MBD1587406.1 taurine dioxygenase [Pseudomonas typographi]MBD1599099.1 taurine dioxygenase [Pseudomonas typographi]